MAKVDARKVIPQVAITAIKRAEGNRQGAWSQYIKAMYEQTGSLAPRCNAKDFYAWYDEKLKQEVTTW